MRHWLLCVMATLLARVRGLACRVPLVLARAPRGGFAATGKWRPPTVLSVRGVHSSAQYSLPPDEERNVPEHTNKGFYIRGTVVEAKVISFSTLGALVALNDTSDRGLVTQTEIMLYREAQGNEVFVGDKLVGYVARVREDNKVDIALRPVVMDRVEYVKKKIIQALQQSENGSIPVGDRSSPSGVGQYFRGVSKVDFKRAIGALYREGLVRPGKFDTSIAVAPKTGEHLVATPSEVEVVLSGLPPTATATMISQALAGRCPAPAKEIRLETKNQQTQAFVKLVGSAEKLKAQLRGLRVGPAAVLVSTSEPPAAADLSRPQPKTYLRSVAPKARPSSAESSVSQPAAPQAATSRIDKMAETVATKLDATAPQAPARTLSGLIESCSVFLDDVLKTDARPAPAPELTKIFVSNLSFTVTAEELRHHFTQQLGFFAKHTLLDVRVPWSPTNVCNLGYAFVDMESPEARDRLMSIADGSTLDGRTLRLDAERKGTWEMQASLLVHDLPPGCSAKALQAHLRKFVATAHDIGGVRIPSDPRGNRFKQAVVEVRTHALAQELGAHLGAADYGLHLMRITVLPVNVYRFTNKPL